MGAVAVNVTLKSAVSGLALIGLLAACEREVILQGERFPIRAALDSSVAVEGEPAPVAPALRPDNLSAPISLPASGANADWTHRGGNSRHAGPHGALSAAPQRVFTVSVGAGNTKRNRVSAAPVVASGRVFTMDARSLVSATSTGGGALWSVDLTAAFDRSSEISGGGLAATAGRVFAATGYGELVALDAGSGAVIWRQRLDSPVSGAPTVEGDTVYVAGRDGAAWAIDAADGKVRWQVPGTPSATATVGGSGPSVAGDLVLFPFANGDIIAVARATGQPVWQRSLKGKRLGRSYAFLGDLTGDPVISGDIAYAGTSAGRTVAMDVNTGQQIWAVGEGALNPPLVVGGSVFVVNDEARLVRLDAGTGEVIWAIDMPYYDKDKPARQKAITAHYGPVLAGGRLVVVSSDGQLRSFDPRDGSLIGGAGIPGGAATSPALAGGLLYVVSGGGQLHAFR